ncbi:MAG: ice-binding family protein [Aeromicrobium sp.]
MTDAIKRARTPSRPLALALSVLMVGGIAAAAVSFAGAAEAASPPDIRLGTAARFGVLAADGVTNTGPTTIAGDVGSAPTTSVTDNGVITSSGVVRTGPDNVVSNAKADLLTAFGQAAAAQPTVTGIPADLTGRTLVAGTYRQASSLLLTGNVTLDAENDTNAVFVIQVGADFATGPGASVTLVRGAQACRVYWQIGNSATFDTTTSFKGNVLAYQDISAATAATFEGRLLTNTGAVTLDTNVISAPGCAAIVPRPLTASPSLVVTPVKKATPKPARTSTSPTDSDDSSDSDDSDDSDSSEDSNDSGTSESDTDTSGGTTVTEGGGGSDSDGSTTTSTPGLPNTGGPPWFLAPLGGLVVLAGLGVVVAARTPRGMHRA